MCRNFTNEWHGVAIPPSHLFLNSSLGRLLGSGRPLSMSVFPSEIKAFSHCSKNFLPTSTPDSISQPHSSWGLRQGNRQLCGCKLGGTGVLRPAIVWGELGLGQVWRGLWNGSFLPETPLPHIYSDVRKHIGWDLEPWDKPGLKLDVRLQWQRVSGTPGHCPDSGRGSPASPHPQHRPLISGL